MLAQLMETQMCLPAGCVGGRLRKGTMASANTSVWEKTTSPALVLMPDNSVPPPMSLVPLELLPQRWSSEGVSPGKSMHAWVL